MFHIHVERVLEKDIDTVFEAMESAVLNDVAVTAAGNVIAVGGQDDTTWIVVVTP